LFLLAGVLVLLELLLVHVAPNDTLERVAIVIAYLALAIAFVVMFLWRSVDVLLRVAFIVTAVGFALMALAEVTNVGVVVVRVAEVLVLVGFLVAGILAFLRRVFGRTANLVFLILGIVVALLFLSQLFAFITGTLLLILYILFGAGLVVVGVLITRRR
jgi:hypothetical protein